MIRGYRDKLPQIGQDGYIDDAATLIGEVSLGDRVSVWPGAVLRGDEGPITVGDGTSLQDNCVLHASLGTAVRVGSGVTVGHGAILHGCIVEDSCLIGMGAVVLDDAVVGARSIVGAGALVTGRTQIPPESMVMGSPAKVVRSLTPEELSFLVRSAREYEDLIRDYIGAQPEP